VNVGFVGVFIPLRDSFLTLPLALSDRLLSSSFSECLWGIPLILLSASLLPGCHASTWLLVSLYFFS
jgi:hypothetical protein